MKAVNRMLQRYNMLLEHMVLTLLGMLNARIPDLLLTEEDLNRNAGQTEMHAQLVLYESAVRVLDVLRQVAVESESGSVRW